jgi:FKBP-type peptidyl-prolyl cis-trans isomerase SlyD
MMKAQVISFHCVLRNKVGELISSTFNHDIMIHIEREGELLQALTEGLQNLHKGEKRRIHLKAEQAYGFYDPELVIEVSRKKLSDMDTLELGNQIVSESSGGKLKVFRVIQTSRDLVTLDANHPLAGQDLVFDIEATEARDATSEEIAESVMKHPTRYYH